MTTLIDVIDRAAETYKNKIAFTDIRESFSFEEVRMLGRRIASALLQAGVMFRPVAIYMERSAKIPAAMAGVLLSANFYTVLDTESPPERLSKIAETLETPLILCDGAAEERCKEIFPEKTVLSYEKAVLHTSDAARLAEAAKKLLPGDQAFTIFTSGSTGTPKGTVLTHANVIAYCGWFVERFSIGPDTNFGSQSCMKNKPTNFNVTAEIPCHVGSEIPVIPYYRPGSPELAKAVVEAMLKHNSVLLTNHGQVVCGKDFDQVYERATFFEMACRIIVQSGGDYSVLTPAEIEDLEIYVLGKKTN